MHMKYTTSFLVLAKQRISMMMEKPNDHGAIVECQVTGNQQKPKTGF